MHTGGARAEQRRKEALERQARTADLPPEAKLARLDQLHGHGLGAARERRKLQARIEAAAKKPQRSNPQPKKEVARQTT